MNTKPIVVVEGPAGSGKSTLCNLLVSQTGLPLVARSLPQRAPGENEAIYHSAVNDMAKFMVASTKPDGAIIDRLFFSQWVYGHLRRGKRIPKPEFSAMIFHYERLIEVMMEDLACRAGTTVWPFEPKIMVILLLPSRSQIDHYRSLTGNTYAFLSAQELEIYRRVEDLRSWLPTCSAFTELCIWTESHYGPVIGAAKSFKHKWKPDGADHRPGP